MARRLGHYTKPLEPIDWPDGNGGFVDQPVRAITWAEQELMTDIAEGASPREVMPKLMPVLLPGRSWDEIRTTLSAEDMQEVIAYASRQYEAAMEAMKEAVGKTEAGTSPPSAPTTPTATSSPESLPASAVPCGM